MAAAYEPSTIAAAKLHAEEGFPCVLGGTVTMVSGDEFYLQDPSGGVRVVSDPYLLHVGEKLEVEGWMYLADGGEFQMRARRLWRVAKGPAIQPRPVTLETALAGEHQGELIGVQGSVLSVDFGKDFDSVSIQSGRSSLRIFCPSNPHGRSVFESIYPGMQVAVAGISVPQTVAPEYDGSQLRLRGPADLQIRGGRRSNSLPVEWGIGLGFAATLMAGVAVWGYRGLRRQPAPVSQVQ